MEHYRIRLLQHPMNRCNTVDAGDLTFGSLGELMELTDLRAMEEYPFLQSDGLPPLKQGSAEFAEFERLYEQIQIACHAHSPLRKKQVGYLLLLILLKIRETFPCDHHRFPDQGQKTDVLNDFKLLLRKHYQDLYNGYAERANSAKEYANALGMHPNYLNYIIKKKSGRSVSRWIIDKTISESKSLLAHSSFSIKEIAYRLGFAEPSYFCRYFKKYTKMTAVEYRTNCCNTGMLTGVQNPVLTPQTLTA